MGQADTSDGLVSAIGGASGEDLPFKGPIVLCTLLDVGTKEEVAVS